MSKAPDKIYVTIPSRLKGDSPNYVGIAFKNRDHLTTPQIEEYIRKDALLGWAKECTASFNEQMEKVKPTDISYRVLSGGISTIELLLNKINSL